MSITATNRVTWKGTVIGDHAFVTFEYQGNTDKRIIPRGKGIKIWSTEELGGGFLEISVSGIKSSANRAALENYFYTLDDTFELNAPGDLVISNPSGGNITLSDCYLESFSQGDADFKSVTFEMKFVKSL